MYESTGQEVIFDNWKPGQPNSLDGQNCGKVHMEDNNYWFDDRCDSKNHFVCQKGILYQTFQFQDFTYFTFM